VDFTVHAEEEIRLLVKHCGLSYEAACALPLPIRSWWLDQEEAEQEKRRQQQANQQGRIPR
jgi:hypothetical protein